MGRGMDPYMIRYRSTRPRGGSGDCKTSRKKDPKGGKAPPSKKKEGYGGGKAKKKWSKDKVEAPQEGH
uniref:Uncharacterized protein n=1 Tax=Caenorhabditis japonica TaxID=281687 RepID=A0A8R1I1Y6_CAEJA